ncbi:MULTISPECIES: hypothetical protein [Streptococcus]|jgi:hypothetical protein|uniref:Uncharacterized protein n=1 Tax=Streptococcus oralis TaxID=1303 RepID=A0A3R9M2K1_STROR|nr:MULTISPECIES: hypothetical protein [Streptococcus]MBR9645868.1 hypothetical protein [Streptococcus sp. 11-4097]OAN19475.1 hypothetical protein A3Q39_07090 [Streptococcus sp. CCUG 49591]RSK21017.1 hypothetical protein D8800_07545 [Streptococcus oralis]
MINKIKSSPFWKTIIFFSIFSILLFVVDSFDLVTKLFELFGVKPIHMNSWLAYIGSISGLLMTSYIYTASLKKDSDIREIEQRYNNLPKLIMEVDIIDSNLRLSAKNIGLNHAILQSWKLNEFENQSENTQSLYETKGKIEQFPIVERNDKKIIDIPLDKGIEISNIKEIIIIYTDIFEKNYYYNKFENEDGKFNQVGECGIFDQNRTEKNKVKISK